MGFIKALLGGNLKEMNLYMNDVPQKTTDPAIVLEFKVHDPDEEKTLQEAVASALKQIEEKAYDSMLVEHGISKKQIRHYGFAFEGRRVLIGGN